MGTPLHPQRVLLLFTEDLGQPKSIPIWGQLPDKPRGDVPSTAGLQQIERLSHLFVTAEN